jgi:hypothetical protein
VLNQDNADWYKILLVVDGADGTQEKKYGYVPASYLLIEEPESTPESPPKDQPEPRPEAEPEAEPEPESVVA